MPNYELAARRAAQRRGIDPNVFVAQLRQENGLKPTGRSGAGAQGIAQFIPSTAAAYGVNLNDGKVSDDLDGAARLMRDNLKKFGGNVSEALAAYNAGAGAVEKYHGVPPFAETQKYVSNILAAAKRSGSSGGGAALAKAAGASHAASAGTQTTTTSVTPQTDTSSDTSAVQVLQQALARPAQAVASAGVPLPAFAAGPKLAGAGVASSGSAAVAKPDIGALLAQVQPSAASVTPGPTITQKTTSKLAAATGAPGSEVAAKVSGDPLAFAKARIGHYAENEGPNRGDELDKLQSRFGLKGAAWCAMFATVAATKGGAAIPRTASVASIRADAQAGKGYVKGVLSTSQAQPGDLWMNGDAHVGVIESVDRKRGTITTIEGNTSANKVARVTRPINTGDIARPKYGANGRA